jgi:hypothetical protein
LPTRRPLPPQRDAKKQEKVKDLSPTPKVYHDYRKMLDECHKDLDAVLKAGKQPGKRGRPRTDKEIREIIVRLAKENGWGYTRILGELRKLGIRRASRSTVINVLKQHGLDPGPQRGEGSWDEFLKIHAKTLWACDFLSKKVCTKWILCQQRLGGLSRQYYRQAA